MLEESIHTLKTSLPKIPPTLIDLPVSWSFEESDFSSESDMIQFFRDVDTLKTHDDIDIFARDFSEHMAAWNVSSRASFDTLIRLAHVRVSLGAYGVSKLKKTERDIIFEFRVGVTLQNIRDFLTRYSDLDITLVGTERARIPSASIKDISEFLQRLTD